MEFLIAFMVGATVFFLVLLIAVLLTPKTVSLAEKETKTVKDICASVFKSSPDLIAHKLGIATDKYFFNCNMLNIDPHLELIILSRIIAVCFLIVGIIASILLQVYYVGIIIGIISLLVIILPTYNIQSRASKAQHKFESEIPRFLDLLLTALKIDLPVATAIQITAESIDGLLSEELLKALAKSEIGASNWQDALYDIAQKYEVDAFSDFVLDIVTAYQKGTDISESVERQSRDIKQASLLKAKEDASRVTSTVLIPIAIFKMLPLMVILFLPIILQLTTNF